MPTRTNRSEISHDRIVEVASREVRRTGFAGVGVADVMRRAGLTHGGFYAHFGSRGAMLAEAIERACRDSECAMAERIEAQRERGVGTFRALVELYLSDTHLRGTEQGCVVAALASEMARQDGDVAKAAAAWAMTNGVRLELLAQNTQMLGMHVGFVDTDLTAGLDVPKARPDDVVRITLDALEAGASEVLVDEFTRQVHRGLSADPAVYLQPIDRPSR